MRGGAPLAGGRDPQAPEPQLGTVQEQLRHRARRADKRSASTAGQNGGCASLIRPTVFTLFLNRHLDPQA